MEDHELKRELAARALTDIKEQKNHILRYETYRRNPLKWLEEVMGEDSKAFLWEKFNEEAYANHVWDGDPNPLAAAWNRIADSYTQVKKGGTPDFKYVAVQSGTGTGKTYWLARLVFWYLDCFENSLVITSAPSDAQLGIGLWNEINMINRKIKQTRPRSKKFSRKLIVEYENTAYMDENDKEGANSWQAVAFTTGVKADEESSNKARGFHRKDMLIILEECTGIPASILTAFQNTSTGNTNFIVAVGNPNNEFDTLNQFAIQKDCYNIRVSGLDHPNIVMQKELVEGAVTQSSINSRTVNYTEESPLWQAMVRGISPAQSLDALIRKEWVDQCVDLTVEDISKYPEAVIGMNAIGLDVANSIAGDKASAVYGEGPVMTVAREFQCENATHLAYNIIYDSPELSAYGYADYDIPTMYETNVEASYIGIDAVGVGVATVNGFIDKNLPQIQALSGGFWVEVVPTMVVHSGNSTQNKPMYSFSNLRTQMYWEFREDLRRGFVGLKLPKHVLEQLTKELCIPKFSMKGGRIELESKADIKKRMGGKSPNLADAAAYWNWSRKGYRVRLNSFLPLG